MSSEEFIGSPYQRVQFVRAQIAAQEQLSAASVSCELGDRER
jgi:hypothetical protein